MSVKHLRHPLKKSYPGLGAPRDGIPMKTALMASIGLAVVVALAGVVSLVLIAPAALTAPFGGSNPNPASTSGGTGRHRRRLRWIRNPGGIRPRRARERELDPPLGDLRPNPGPRGERDE